jgi:hypothetical protein
MSDRPQSGRPAPILLYGHLTVLLVVWPGRTHTALVLVLAVLLPAPGQAPPGPPAAAETGQGPGEPIKREAEHPA